METRSESESNTLLKCTRIGCSETFRWRIQLKRHLEVCDKPVDPTPPAAKGYEVSGFTYLAHGKKSDYRKTILRHIDVLEMVKLIYYVNKERYSFGTSVSNVLFTTSKESGVIYLTINNTYFGNKSYK